MCASGPPSREGEIRRTNSAASLCPSQDGLEADSSAEAASAGSSSRAAKLVAALPNLVEVAFLEGGLTQVGAD